MTAIEILNAVKNAGGSLALKGGQIKYPIPKRSKWLVPEVRQQKQQLIDLLRERETSPSMPAGVRLVSWEPKNPPVAIVRMGIVSNVHRFIDATFQELRARLEGKNFLAGNWSLRELVERLEEVGIVVEIEEHASLSRGADADNANVAES